MIVIALPRPLAFFVVLIGLLQQPLHSADAQTVATLETPPSFALCASCHGQQAQGNSTLKAPSLAGQSISYLTRQLNNFASGRRGADKNDLLGHQMVGFAQQLKKNNEIDNLATYLNSLKVQVPALTLTSAEQARLKNGSRYYQAKCGACHGGNAQGNEAFNAPKLTGLSTDYLALQMTNFVNGVRGSHEKDRLGRQMAMMAKMTSGKELDDILHYIASQE